MARSHAGFRNPHRLPYRTCAGCGRPFTWRRKWARDWDQVRYCSDRCRQHARRGAGGAQSSPGTRARTR